MTAAVFATMTAHHVPRRQPPPPERSPEERARAAAERAARRGESVPPPETFLGRRTVPPEPLPITGNLWHPAPTLTQYYFDNPR